LAKKRIVVRPGQSLRIIRELQGLSQVQLAELCGIPQSTISGIETGRINLGVERAKTLAIALRCHPAVLVFPGWQVAA
jgi:transcriptional regulator with XRE-family HTH domain